jgi:hypothetical protein
MKTENLYGNITISEIGRIYSVQKSFWDKSKLIVIWMAFQAVVILTLAVIFQVYFFIFAVGLFAFVGFVNAYIFRKRMRYFFQGIKINHGKIVLLDLYLQDENQQLRLPLQNFVINFERNWGKGRYVKLSFFDGNQLLGFQYDYRHWTHENMAELFRAVKQVKNEPITAIEERMMKKDFFLAFGLLTFGLWLHGFG